MQTCDSVALPLHLCLALLLVDGVSDSLALLLLSSRALLLKFDRTFPDIKHWIPDTKRVPCNASVFKVDKFVNNKSGLFTFTYKHY